MKGWWVAPLALLAGLLIGSWGPRSDLRAARQELETARKRADEHTRRRDDLGGLTRLIGIDEAGKKTGASAPPAPKPVTTASRPAGESPGPADPARKDAPILVKTGEDAAVDASARPPGAGSPGDPSDGRPLKDRIDDAIDLWKTRSDIARSGFVSNLELTADQAAQFDVAVAAMNLRIGGTLQNLAASLRTNGQFNAESAIGVANEVTGAMVLAYRDLDRSLPPDWRQKAGREFALTDFVDPNVARPLIGVEDKLQGAAPFGD